MNQYISFTILKILRKISKMNLNNKLVEDKLKNRNMNKHLMIQNNHFML